MTQINIRNFNYNQNIAISYLMGINLVDDIKNLLKTLCISLTKTQLAFYRKINNHLVLGIKSGIDEGEKNNCTAWS